jgi:hypothetical protein
MTAKVNVMGMVMVIGHVLATTIAMMMMMAIVIMNMTAAIWW